ncbi:MAG: ABC transporter ATP-binding protein [Acidimicrobiia bacterium]
MLTVEHVTVEFGGLRAIDDVTFEIGSDQIVSIVGPNGAGKTTLLNAICGAVTKSHGQVIHNGIDISQTHPSKIARHGIGRSFQDPQLLEDATVLENVLCGAHTTIGYNLADQIYRRRRVRRLEKAATERACELLELVGLPGMLHVDASELAYGARKIVDIVRATMSQPMLLLLDEPSSGLDRGERHQVEQMLMSIRRQFGIPMLVVEHHMDLVRRISDRVVGLIAGGVAASGTPSEVLDSEDFRAQITGAVSTTTPDPHAHEGV